MKKLLAVLLALCLMASMPLLAIAGDATDTSAEATEASATEEAAPAAPSTTTASSQKVTISFDASLSSTEMSADELAAAQGVIDFAKSLQLEIAFAEADDMLLGQVVLLVGGSELGKLDIAIDGETMYITGDMLPEGWITLDMAQLTEELSSQFSAMQMEGTPANQEAMTQAMLVLVEQLMVSVEGWLSDHPEVIEQMPLENLPANMDPVMDWIRVNIPKDMYPAIYQSMDASLRDLAAKGELNDFDGSAVSAANYDDSTIGQMMGSLVEAMDSIEIEGVIDVLADDQGTLPGFSVDLTADNYTMFLTLLRKTGDSGDVAWSGEFEMKDDPVTTQVEATIAAANNAPDAETRRLEGDIAGHVIDVSSSSDQIVSFDLSGSVEYPGESAVSPAQLFHVALFGDITASESEKLDFNFDMYANQVEGDAVDFQTGFGFNFLDGSSSTSFATSMGILSQEADGLPVPNLTGAKLYPVTDMSEEELEAYMTEASGTAMSFLFKLLAALPPSLQSQLMQQ